MHERKSWNKKVWNDKRIYSTYESYPVNWDTEQQLYYTENDSEETERTNNHISDNNVFLHASDTIFPRDFFLSPLVFQDNSPFKTLKLLNSLFSDRLDFLNKAIEELDNAQNERDLPPLCGSSILMTH